METLMHDLRLYIDAILAIAIMSFLAILGAFAAAAITGDRTLVIMTTIAVFVLSGAVFVVRLWRTTRKPVLPIDPNA
jgi:hypothetical protein